jgi:hypothetical protein
MPSDALITACEELFLVNLPKRVRIRNLRLGLLLFFLRCIAVVWIVYLLYEGRPWQRVYIPTGAFAFWASTSSQLQQARTVDDVYLCDPANISRYSYQYGADTNYRYTNIRCVDILPGARFTKGESELFVPTFFEETLSVTRSAAPTSVGGDHDISVACSSSCTGLGPCSHGGSYSPSGLNELGNCICECSSVRNRFVYGVSSMNISFEHAAQVQWTSNDEHTVHSQVVSDRLRTIVRHPTTKQALAIFEPGATVTMSLSQLLDLAQVSLQNQVRTTRPNGLQGEASFMDTVLPYPLLRMTGMILKVNLLYYNAGDLGHDSSYDGPICYVELEPELTWSSRPRLDYGQPVDASTGEGSLRYRYYYGIRVKFTAAGSFSRFDIWTLAMYLVACAVYIQVPGTIVDIIVTYCLGSLSKVYRCVTLPVVTTSALLSGMVARSLAAKAAFEALLRKQVELHEDRRAPDSRIISAGSLDVMLQELLAHKEVGEVGKELSETDMEAIRNQLLGAKGKMGLREGDFIWASTNNEGDGEAVTFRLLAKWFAGDRKQAPLERLFDNTRSQRLNLRSSSDLGNIGGRQVIPIGGSANERE